MKKSAILISLLIAATHLWAGNNNAGLAGSYTRLGLGGRTIAMGNTGVAGPAGGYSQYYNPALSGRQDKKVVALSYSFMSQDRYVGFVGYSMKIPPGGGLSLGWLVSGTNNLYGYNSIGQRTGEINHSAHAIYGSFARHFSERLSVGITIKVLLEYINDGTADFDYEGTGVGGDIGIYYAAMDDLALGVIAKDIGSNIKANTEDIFERGGTTVFDFPRQYRLGAFYTTPLRWLNTAYDLEFSDQGELEHHFGLEALHGRNLALRTGLNGSQFVAGAGFDFALSRFIAHLDYTFIGDKAGEGASHLFSWEIYF